MASGNLKSKTITLDEREATLRQLLLDAAKHIDDTTSPETASEQADSTAFRPPELQKAKTELRFTGGWVRDKLLGVGSHDIDVAINKWTGYEFGLKMKTYLETADNAAKYQLASVQTNGSTATAVASKTVSDLHKIAPNPERSKHLETVTTRILGLDIDLVNLRKETYTQVSRNPQMEFGTPEEDADRRDATVNALFYNLHTQIVEDFTQRGLDDMSNKIIRTPLEPYQTFKDDPLRVLRLIRFASRLNYTIDPESELAMDHSEIKEALRLKISRERIATELEKMLKGPDPVAALSLIDRLNLYSTIFSDPNNSSENAFVPHRPWKVAYNTLAHIQSEGLASAVKSICLTNAEDFYQAWVLACFVPLIDAPDVPAPKAGKPAIPLAVIYAREGTKAPNKITDLLTSAITNRTDIISIKDRLLSRKRFPNKPAVGTEEDPTARDVLGMAIRRWGPTWRSQALFALMFEVTENPDAEQAIFESYSKFLRHLEQENLIQTFAVRPMITGTQLAKALGMKPGPWMKDALETVVAWQLRNPDANDADEAIAQVREKQGELPSLLATQFLKLTVRPLFVNSQHSSEPHKRRQATLTSNGRRNAAVDAIPSRLLGNLSLSEEHQQKLWKDERKGPDALEALEWVLHFCQPQSLASVGSRPVGSRAADSAANEAKSTFVKQNWSLLVPPILTVLDDSDVKVKTAGCRLTTALILASPSSHLQRTGLTRVFQEALAPCLTYLPTLTPANDSAAILTASHTALRALAWATHPPTQANDTTTTTNDDTTTSPFHPSSDPNHASRTTLLLTLLRTGFLHPYNHINGSSIEHPAPTLALLTALPPLISDIGIDTVVHLKDLVPLLADVLADPFVLSGDPRLVAAACEALRAVMGVTWPRVGGWRSEVLRGLCVGWVRLVEDEAELEDGQRQKLRGELRLTAGMLRVVVEEVEEEVDFGAEIGELVRADGRLEGLFARGGDDGEGEPSGSSSSSSDGHS